MTNLTEQWKKGELKAGCYYLKVRLWSYEEMWHDCYKTDVCSYNIFKKVNHNDIKEVLAPVPSFEEWQSLNELLDSMQDTNKALAHRLNICKELLKRCRDFINYEVPDHCIDDVLIDKIDEVLK